MIVGVCGLPLFLMLYPRQECFEILGDIYVQPIYNLSYA